MTRDRARKKAIRARMAVSGEPYNVAARKLDAADPGNPAVADDIVARANRTLAAPHARIEVRQDFTRSIARPERRPPGPVARLARRAAEATWKRVSPEMDLATMREMFRQQFTHLVGEGFVEPAADLYQLDFGGYAEMRFNGEYYGGASGRPLRANHHQTLPDDPLQEPLDSLRKLRDVTEARLVGHETVRGTPCRVVATRAGSLELTVWIDDDRIRRVQWVRNVPGELASGSMVRTFELWDFGAEDDSADWTHLPKSRAPVHGQPGWRDITPSAGPA